MINLIIIFSLFIIILFFVKKNIVIDTYQPMPGMGMGILSPTQIKILAIKSLKKKITNKHDSSNLKNKKMINYYLKELENNVNSKIQIVKNTYNINANTDRQGCVNFSKISRKVFALFFGSLKKDNLNNDLNNTLNKFNEQYSFYINEYLRTNNKQKKLIKNKTLKLKKLRKPKNRSEFLKYIHTFLDNNLFLELKTVLLNIKYDFRDSRLIIHDENTLKKELKKSMEQFNIKKFMEKLMEFNNSLKQIQCDMYNPPRVIPSMEKTDKNTLGAPPGISKSNKKCCK